MNINYFAAWRNGAAEWVRAIADRYGESALRVGHSNAKGYGDQGV
ncbi:MAG: hypothetical protein OSA84_03020 [Akkermansiaceae bacterium]|nr:hypothetical protein [Akkermansiaceae bacterium]